VPGTAATLALFKGIPQQLNVLGKARAPVTMIEFADLQCPFCRDYTASALPALVARYVRAGKAKFVFAGMHFIGPDSEKALRAVYAAGLQGRLWQYLDLLYKSQGPENEGWVTDDLLRSVGASLPGFDTDKMLAGMSSAEVTNALATSDQQAQNASVSSTPTFFAGKTGATLEHINLTTLTPDAFRPTLDALTT
jgi:protein-disulfide isomerase